MTSAFVKKIIFFISTLFLTNLLHAANLQYFVDQSINQYLSNPFDDYMYQPSPMMDKAIANLPAYSNVKKCSSDSVTDAIVIIKPILSYQPQSTILYGDLKVKIYQSKSNRETHPDNFIREMNISHWKVLRFDKVTMDHYVNEVYTKLLEQLILKIDALQINKNYPTNGSLCDLLSTSRKSKINLRH
ncbi:MAG: hypothetical protein HOE03_04355 [Nitrosomonadales bacterium]|nr:hypothetical protein [Nitrosomonadales bacterium]